MKRTVHRTYELSRDDVLSALFYYFGNSKDWPVPENYADALLSFDSNYNATITFTEEIADA